MSAESTVGFSEADTPSLATSAADDMVDFATCSRRIFKVVRPRILLDKGRLSEKERFVVDEAVEEISGRFRFPMRYEKVEKQMARERGCKDS